MNAPVRSIDSVSRTQKTRCFVAAFDYFLFLNFTKLSATERVNGCEGGVGERFEKSLVFTVTRSVHV